MQSKLSQGEVVISLGGEELTLKTTLFAAKVISRTTGGLRAVVDTLAKGDLDTMESIIKIGAGLNDKAARGLDQKIWDEMNRSEAAFGELISSLMTYVGNLQRGGRPWNPNEDVEGDTSGNAA